MPDWRRVSAAFSPSSPRRRIPGCYLSPVGFAAGVMIYISFVEILGKARDSLSAELGEAGGAWAAVVAFFVGMAVVALIDKLIPSFENPHEVHRLEERETRGDWKSGGRLMRVGLLSAPAVAIHNLPEGLATFASSLEDPALGISIAVTVAIHNVPEGVAVAVPIYYSTGNKRKALLYSFLSGMAEPVGAAVGFLLLWQFFSPLVFGIIFASVAGIVVFISMDQLLPTAREYGEHHLTVYGLVSGMAVMAFSLLLLL